jgi:hypothetical protein
MDASTKLHKFYFTFINNKYATRLYPEELTLDALAEKIRTTVKPTKDKLPWLKMAEFGS